MEGDVFVSRAEVNRLFVDGLAVVAAPGEIATRQDERVVTGVRSDLVSGVCIGSQTWHARKKRAHT